MMTLACLTWYQLPCGKCFSWRCETKDVQPCWVPSLVTPLPAADDTRKHMIYHPRALFEDFSLYLVSLLRIL